MFGELILFLPSIFGLTFGLIAMISKKKSNSIKELTFFMFLGCIYFFVDSNFLHQIDDYQQYIISDVLMVSLGMLLPISTVHYLNALSPDNRTNMRYLNFVFICMAIAFGASSAILYGVMGLDNATEYISSQIDKKELSPIFNDRIYQIHFLINTKAFYIASGIEALFVIYVAGKNLLKGDLNINKVVSFIRNDRPVKINIASIQSLLVLIITILMSIRICMGRVGLLSHMTLTYLLSALIAAVVFAINIVAFASEGLELSRRNSSNSFGSSAVNTLQQSTYFPEESFDSLKVKFENAMRMERIFLDPDLTITTMSISMETNRTYLSRLVNMVYKTDFRTYINTLRINYAKDLIIHEPSASMEYVALKSGFKTLSQFNRKFKEIDGETPRRWQLMQINSNKK